MTRKYVLPGGYFADYTFIAILNDDENDWIGGGSIEEVLNVGRERWSSNSFEIVECIVADGVSFNACFLCK